MKQKIVVRGPVLSQSGYGEQTRFALRALRSQEDILDIHIIPVGWGESGWISDESEERQWLDSCIKKAAQYIEPAKQKQVPLETLFDISLQVTIPNEWERMAAVNIGYTAGIETTKVAPQWIEKANFMDRIIVVSNHSKEVFEDTVYTAQNPQNAAQVATLKCKTPIDVVNYCIRKETPTDLDLDLEYDFNFLCMAQWGPRKNLTNTIEWFIEENFDREVGLVIKTSIKNNSIIDRNHTQEALNQILEKHSDRKCKIYLLHGDMSKEELAGLYTHPKIKAMITATHGEGFGLPLFEAACHALPVVAPGWSGQCDFLYMPDNRRKNSDKKKPMFSSVEYEVKQIQKEAVWDGVIQEDSQWCFPKSASFKRRLREMVTKYSQIKKTANKLQKWILKEFTEEKQYGKFIQSLPIINQIEVQDFEGISFCIATNGKKVEKTKYVIKSLQNQITTKETEIIVVGVVNEFEGMDGIKLIDATEQATTGLLAELRNIGARNSTHDVVCYLDDDILFPPNWLWNLEEYSKKEGWDVLGTRILNPDGSRLWDRATMNPHVLVQYDHSCFDKNLYQTGGFSIHRKKVFENLEWDGTIAAFSEKRGKVNEDIDYSQRLHASGYILKFDKENLVWHWDSNYTQVQTQQGSLTLKKDIITAQTGHTDFAPPCPEFNSLLSMLGVVGE